MLYGRNVWNLVDRPCGLLRSQCGEVILHSPLPPTECSVAPVPHEECDQRFAVLVVVADDANHACAHVRKLIRRRIPESPAAAADWTRSPTVRLLPFGTLLFMYYSSARSSHLSNILQRPR